MKKFLFVDLDDTLFQSLGKSLGKPDLHPAAFLKDGSAYSFTTPLQRSLFEMIDREMTLIPVTARNHNALNRVGLKFFSYSVIDYGGVVLEPDGSIDKSWMNLMQVDLSGALDGLNEIKDMINQFSIRAGYKARARLIEDYSMPFYVVYKDPDKQAEPLERITSEILEPWIATAGSDFYFNRNGNNLAVLPVKLNKTRAVQYLRQILQNQYGDILTIGMGDSKSDARFMASCDYAIIPSGTQLSALTLAMQ